MVLIWSTSEGWKAESTFNPPNGFEHGTPRLGIQQFKRKIALIFLQTSDHVGCFICCMLIDITANYYGFMLCKSVWHQATNATPCTSYEDNLECEKIWGYVLQKGYSVSWKAL